MADIPCFNYAGMSLRQKWDMMHSGEGGAAVMPAADTLVKLAPEFIQTADAVQAALRSVGVDWEGGAATAFTGVLSQFRQWADDGSRVPHSGGGQVQTYSGSYDATRAAIPDPATVRPVGEQSTGGAFLDAALGKAKGVFDVQSDYSRRVAAYQAADDAANHALTAHETASGHTLDSFPPLAGAPALSGNSASATHSATADHPPTGTTAAGPAATVPDGGKTTGQDTGASAGSPTGTGIAAHIPSPPSGPSRTPNLPAGTATGSGTYDQPSTVPVPPLPPSHQYRPGAIRDALEPGRQLIARGTATPSEARPSAAASPGAPSPGRSAAPAGMPMGAAGGAGKQGDKEHRNNVFIPENDIFYAPVDESEWLVTPAVITPEWIEEQSRS